MISKGMKKSVAALVVSALVLGAVGAAVGVGEAQDAPVAKAKEAKQPAKKTQRAKPRGPLPAFYGRVVDQKQRKQIYAIQNSHAAEIAALQSQLNDLLAKRNAEVAAVLTAEQRAEVAKLVAAAKAKRQKKAAEKKAAAGE